MIEITIVARRPGYIPREAHLAHTRAQSKGRYTLSSSSLQEPFVVHETSWAVHSGNLAAFPTHTHIISPKKDKSPYPAMMSPVSKVPTEPPHKAPLPDASGYFDVVMRGNTGGGV